jgi:hypothetical protein
MYTPWLGNVVGADLRAARREGTIFANSPIFGRDGLRAVRLTNVASALEPSTSRLPGWPNDLGSTSREGRGSVYSVQAPRHRFVRSTASGHDPRHTTDPGAEALFRPAPLEEQPEQ